MVLGHEGSGTILELGAGRRGLQVGDRVALESHLICGRCWACRTGHAHTCENTRILGMHIDGVFAEQVAVPADICVKLPDPVFPSKSAPFSSPQASPCTPSSAPVSPRPGRTS